VNNTPEEADFRGKVSSRKNLPTSRSRLSLGNQRLGLGHLRIAVREVLQNKKIIHFHSFAYWVCELTTLQFGLLI